MEIEVYAVPHWNIQFTKAHINVLMELANHHYDGVCRDAARVGGFIYGWNNHIQFYELPSPVSANSRQVDICLKILEDSSHLHHGIERSLANEMRIVLHKAIRAKNSFKLE